jgi:hypothetical protein
MRQYGKERRQRDVGGKGGKGKECQEMDFERRFAKLAVYQPQSDAPLERA